MEGEGGSMDGEGKWVDDEEVGMQGVVDGDIGGVDGEGASKFCRLCSSCSPSPTAAPRRCNPLFSHSRPSQPHKRCGAVGKAIPSGAEWATPPPIR